MIKEALLIEKRNYNNLLFLFLLFTISCKSQEYTIDDIKLLEPTHKINSSVVNEILEEIKNDEIKFNKSSNVTVLYIDREQKSSYKLSITKTDFELFRENKSDYYFSKIKGYLQYDDLLILLYGDIDKILFKKKNTKLVKGIMFLKKEKEISPPIIYEPSFIEYKIQNGKIIDKVK